MIACFVQGRWARGEPGQQPEQRQQQELRQFEESAHGRRRPTAKCFPQVEYKSAPSSTYWHHHNNPYYVDNNGGIVVKRKVGYTGCK